MIEYLLTATPYNLRTRKEITSHIFQGKHANKCGRNYTPNTFMLSSYMRTYNFTGSKLYQGEGSGLRHGKRESKI